MVDETVPTGQPQSQAAPLPCMNQTADPAGRAYDKDSLLYFLCTDKHCGLMPLSNHNYWVYEDSVFNDGIFERITTDTLRYVSNIRSLADGLTWWKTDMFVGLPQVLFSNDSTFYSLQARLYNPEYSDARKEFFLFPGDSVRYLTGFDDIAAAGRSLRMKDRLTVPAGDFSDYIYFEKNARNYRKDQVYFKPGLGVLRFVLEKAPFGQRVIKTQHIMNLLSFHIE